MNTTSTQLAFHLNFYKGIKRESHSVLGQGWRVSLMVRFIECLSQCPRTRAECDNGQIHLVLMYLMTKQLRFRKRSLGNRLRDSIPFLLKVFADSGSGGAHL